MPNPELSTAVMEQQPVTEQLEDQRSLSQRLMSTRAGRYATGIAVAAGIGGGFATTANAEDGPIGPVDTIDNTPVEKAAVNSYEVTDMDTTTTVRVGRSQESVKDAASITYIGNFRTVSAAKIREAKQNGDCKYYTGQQAIKKGIKTQGYMGTGVGYAQENRGSNICDVNGSRPGGLVREECGNKVKMDQPRPAKARATVWMNSFNKAKIRVKSKSVATAKAGCELDGVNASASGRGEAYASITGSLRTAAKGKGKLKGSGFVKLVNRANAGANAEATTRAFANAEAKCEKKGGEVTPPTPPVPPKPPVNNPPKADLEGHVHSVTEDEVLVKCYVEDPDGLQDIKNVSLTESGTGSFITNTEQIAPGVFGRTLAVGPVAGEAEVTCTATDKAGQQGSDTERWPVKKVTSPQ